MSGQHLPGVFPGGRPSPGRIAAYAGLLLLGAVVGLAGSLLQAAWFPGGLALSLLGTAALFAGAREATGTQLGVVWPTVGWLLSIVLLSTGRPEGDALFASGIGPIAFMLGGMAAAVICATLWRSGRRDGGTGR
ncbi:DUF6113 family protein [Streptomyces sp. NPDC047968]|uniref:DUF6113 family protein n=1 Tax=unclassified Streptomyces TaxID=2593676 RepID=UPI003423E86D